MNFVLVRQPAPHEFSYLDDGLSLVFGRLCVCSSSRLAAGIHVVLQLHRVLRLLKPRGWNNSCLANSCGLGCGLARAILEGRVTLFWCCSVEGGEDM